MIYMYKTLRIHTFIHICCMHIYLYIYIYIYIILFLSLVANRRVSIDFQLLLFNC